MFKPPQPSTVQFRASDYLAASLDRRGSSRGSIAKRDLPRYYQVIDATERQLSSKLTPMDRLEIAAAVKAHPGPRQDPLNMWIAVHRSPYWNQPGQSTEHGRKLSDKVRHLTPIERMALADFTDRILTQGLIGDPEFELELNEASVEQRKKQLLELLSRAMEQTP